MKKLNLLLHLFLMFSLFTASKSYAGTPASSIIMVNGSYGVEYLYTCGWRVSIKPGNLVALISIANPAYSNTTCTEVVTKVLKYVGKDTYEYVNGGIIYRLIVVNGFTFIWDPVDLKTGESLLGPYVYEFIHK